jgi:hypothetical protein
MAAVQRNSRLEGQRCATQHRKDGSFPLPLRLVTVPASEVVLMHEVTDFWRDRPAFRLYMLESVMGALGDALDWQDTARVRAQYEATCLEAAWGALFFAVDQPGRLSTERVARRLQAVLRFWEPLLSARYVHKILHQVLTLEELMVSACAWVMDAWNPEGASSIRARLEVAAERMARAAREDCVEAILRQMPQALTHARNLKHREVLRDPGFIRQRLEALEPAAFERVSSAFTAHVIELLYDWDHQLGLH